MKTGTNRSVNSRGLARAAAFCLLALAGVLLQSGEARAQWTTSGTTTSTASGVAVGTTDTTSGGKVGAKFIVSTTDDNSTAFATSNGMFPRFALNNHSDG